MKAFLFDLDGTLLGMNTRSFTETYFGELARALHGLVPADGLARNMLSATARMQEDDSPGGTNLTKFRAAFAVLYPDIDHQRSGTASWSSTPQRSTACRTSSPATNRCTAASTICAAAATASC